MDRNFLLAFALSLLVITLWMSMQPPPQPAEQTPQGSSQAAAPTPGGPDEPTEPGAASTLPDWEPAAPGSAQPATPFTEMPAVPMPGAPAAAASASTVRVTTDLFDAELSPLGGSLVSWELREYSDASRPGDPPVSLVTNAPGLPPALATPFQELGLGDWSTVPFSVDQPDQHTVVFTHTQDGVTLRKTYRFEEGRYDFRLDLELLNGTTRVLEPFYKTVWPAQHQESVDYAEFGLVAYQEEEGLQQQRLVGRGASGCGVGSGGAKDKVLEGNVHWAGAQTRYFVAAILPEVAAVTSVRFVPGPDESAAVVVGQNKIQLGPGASHDYEYRVYVGPKEPERLEGGVLGAAHLDQAAQLGYRWVAPLTHFFSWLLVEFYAFIPNYGVVIILITVLVRLVTAPLLGRQMRSMKRMSTQMQSLKPTLDAIKEKHGDDRQRMSEETMKAYREAGVNPLGMLGGCLPLLLQFPVFIGLFYALQSAIALRQAPFVGWIDDLSVPEQLFVLPGLDLPVRVLPLIMGGSMFLQQKLTPQTSMDPAQQQMMMTVMPVMFTVLFYQFPSGLVLYWMVSNFLAIAHQLWINRTPA